MFNWSRFPFIRYTLFLILGILVYGWEPEFTWGWIAVLFACCFGVLTLHIFTRVPAIISGVTGLALCAILGYGAALLEDESRRTEHLTAKLGLPIRAFEGEVISGVDSSGSWNRFVVEITSLMIGDTASYASGKVHCYIPRDQDNRLTIGSVIRGYAPITGVSGPKNPGAFDYRVFLARSHIYGQVFVNSDQLQIISTNHSLSLHHVFTQIRQRAFGLLSQHISDPRELGVLSALYLGVREYLGEEVRVDFTTTGSMHVLAVSGLHVGIIYMLLGFLLRRLQMRRPLLYVLVVGFCLWAYALLTGMSPSVMRAVVMFSILLLRDSYYRRSNVYNSIAIAAFVLLIINPNYLYAIGFQLSFLAVIGIVYLFPLLYPMISSRYWLVDRAWALVCVSVAAQFGTLPLSIFYFNQFPIWFLVSNLVVIPIVSLLMGLSIPYFLLGTSWVQGAKILGQAVEKLTWVLNESVGLISRLPMPVVDDLYLTGFSVCTLYFILLAAAVGISFRSKTAIMLMVCGLNILFAGIVLKRNAQQGQRKILLYALSNQIVVDFVSGRQVSTYTHFDEPLSHWDRRSIQVNRYRMGLPSFQNETEIENRPPLLTRDWGDFVVWKGIHILVLTEDGQHRPILAENPDLVILHGIRREYAQEYLAQLRSCQILIGPNYPAWFVDELRRTHPSLPVHAVDEDGYWMLDLNKMQQHEPDRS